MIKKYNRFVNKINEKIGISDISNFTSNDKRYDLFFNDDIDNITSAIAVKNYLKDFDMSLNNAHVIGTEAQVQSSNLKVFVENKNGDTIIKMRKQNGNEISGDLSSIDLFSHTNIGNIKSVNKSDFMNYKITHTNIIDWIYGSNKDLNTLRHTFFMKLFINRMVIYLKNKKITVKTGYYEHINKNINECLVMDSTSNLESMFKNLIFYIKNAEVSNVERKDSVKKLTTPDALAKGILKYIEEKIKEIIKSNYGHSEESNIEYDDDNKILKQYVGKHIIELDKFNIFKNEPDANFMCGIHLPNNDDLNNIGIIDLYCNPYREKTLSYLDLQEVVKLFLYKFKSAFLNISLTLEQAKKINEEEYKHLKGNKYKPINLNSATILSTYDLFKQTEILEKINKDKETELIDNIKSCMDKSIFEWSHTDKRKMSHVRIKMWDIILNNSNGNAEQAYISGLNYLTARPDLMLELFNSESIIDVIKFIGDKICKIMIDIISHSKKGLQTKYAIGSLTLRGEKLVENFSYFLDDEEMGNKEVSKEEFLKIGLNNMNNNFFKIDFDDNGKVTGKFVKKDELETTTIEIKDTI